MLICLISSTLFLCIWKAGVTQRPQEHCSPYQLKEPSLELHLGHRSWNTQGHNRQQGIHQIMPLLKQHDTDFHQLIYSTRCGCCKRYLIYGYEILQNFLLTPFINTTKNKISNSFVVFYVILLAKLTLS